MSMQNKKHLRCAMVLCCGGALMLCALSGRAYGYQVTTTDSGAAILWPEPNADFYINTSGGPSGSLSAIRAAMQTWTDVATSPFSFTYRGSTASTVYGRNDGTNIICFGTLGPGEESTLALNTFWFNAETGSLADSDIKFNTEHAWTTYGSGGSLDVQTIALHELGHALSLDDLYSSYDSAKVMYGYFDLGQIKRELTQDDRNGITYLYSGASTSTTTTTTTISGPVCPAQYVLGEDHPDLAHLRAFRDGPLAQSSVGRRIIAIYYAHADEINAALERSPALRAAAQKIFEAAALLMAR